MRVAALYAYPVKSCAGELRERAHADALGFADDRRFVLIDARQRALTQRTLPALATVRPRLSADAIELALGEWPLARVALEQFEQAGLQVSVWGRKVPASVAPAEANERLSQALGTELRLARLALGAPASFVDAAPLLVTSLASLAALNAQLGQPVGMERFRPNLVIEGATAFAEHDWRRLRIGAVGLAQHGPCGRCEVTTIDQASGERRGPEPLAQLQKFRTIGGAAVFGAYFDVVAPGELRSAERVDAG